MTVIRYPFVRATSLLAPPLLLLLSTTGVHAELILYDVSIVSAPPITLDNEALYPVSGDCTYNDGENPMVSVKFSYEGQDIVTDPVPCTDTGEWSILADITDFGSGLVDDSGIWQSDVAVLAVYTNDTLAVASADSSEKTDEVNVYRNADASRLDPDLVIRLAEDRTVDGEEFQASTNCGASQIIMDGTSGLLTVHDTDCARMVYPSGPDNTGKLAMTDPLTGASGACEFETLTMNGAGDIRITVDPLAAQRCLDDKDDDGILDLQDPEPGTGANNELCVDSQYLKDNVALTGLGDDYVKANAGSLEHTCKAKDSITVQGVSLPNPEELGDPNGYVDVCYDAGQFVRFVSPSSPDLDPQTNEPMPSFSVPLGTTFSVALKGSCPS